MIMTQNEAYYESIDRSDQPGIQYQDDLQLPPDRVFRNLAIQRGPTKKRCAIVSVTVLVILNTAMMIAFIAGYTYHGYRINNELEKVWTKMETLMGQNVTMGNTSTEQLQGLSDIEARVLGLTASYNDLSRTSLEILSRVTDIGTGLTEQVEVLNSSLSDLQSEVFSPLKVYQGCRIDTETCSFHSRPSDQPQYSRSCNTPSSLINITVR